MKEDTYKIAKEYRDNLVNHGRKVAFENPDRLNQEEIQAVTAKIFDEINRVDMAFGYPYHETGVKRPGSISETEQKYLFAEFMDWYSVVETPSNSMLKFILKNYPNVKYKKVLCVGDGENCHLGRKLANKGYKVVSVDPRVSYKWCKRDELGDIRPNFHAVKGSFFDTSEDMIDWADIIVGCKVPLCVQDLINLPKTTIFSISGNPEMYKMRFKGIPITSAEQFETEIKKCVGIRAFKSTGIGKDREPLIFVHDGIQREKERDD